MKYTIAIPTFNNSSIIEKAVVSTLNQDYQNEYEVLVVDNASSDGTSKVLDSFGNKIRRIRNNQTVTLFENHNICLNNAKGEYIIFCHSDDELLPDALSKLNAVLSKRKFPSKYVIWGRSNFRDFYIHLQRYKFPLDTVLAGNNSLKAVLHGGLTPSGTCYSVESFKKIGGFLDTNHKLSPSDLTSMWKLALNGFKFEMSSHMFFWREYASTAIYSTRNVRVESTKVAVKFFLESLSEEEKKLFLETIEDLELLDSVSLILALISFKIKDGNKVFWKLVLKCLSQPKKYINKSSLYIFTELLKMNFMKKNEFILNQDNTLEKIR